MKIYINTIITYFKKTKTKIILELYIRFGNIWLVNKFCLIKY